jgi:hypothetical protein
LHTKAVGEWNKKLMDVLLFPLLLLVIVDRCILIIIINLRRIDSFINVTVPLLPLPPIHSPATTVPAPAPAPAMHGGVGQENGSIILDESIVSKLQNVIVGRSVQSDDLQRWFSQGFCFSDSPPLYGLTQSHGGPCGVISV